MQQQLADAPEVRETVELMLQPRADQPVTLRTPATSGAAVTPGDLLLVAMQAENKDIDRLERLMAMDIRYREHQAAERQREREWQEQDRQRDAMLRFSEDFAAFRGENIVIPLTKHVDRGNAGAFEQAEYHRVSGMLSPALSKHGFGYRHSTEFTTHKREWLEGPEAYVPWVKVTCFLRHRSGHVETEMLEGPPTELKGNTDLQNMQAAASYMKRQSLLTITGTSTGGEDNENLMVKPTGEAPVGPDVGRKIELQNQGDAAAKKGMDALTAWWAKLSPIEQRDMSSFFTGMRKAARAVDERGAQ